MSTPWQLNAACANHPADLWFPKFDSRGALPTARAICATCPVRKPCLDYALTVNVKGVWASTTETDRRKIRRRLGIVPQRLTWETAA